MSNPSVSLVPPAPPAVDDPVGATHRAVIDLFASQLAKVAFPDVDAALLRRHADEVRAEALAVIRARELLEAAQRKLAERTATLGDTVARGLAYARIYAEADPGRHALAAAIAALAAPSVTPRDAVLPRRRGRPPKVVPQLFAARAGEPAPPRLEDAEAGHAPA